ncbi:MAG: phenylacetate--CoA ligase [Candidatus Melainabacteria bacterium]|nr:phenylacetate--CoA ligase [Candidatus Melainabacteria bacterium]
MWNSKLERMPRTELEALQLTRLQQVVEHVFHKVPFFKQQLKNSGVTPESIKCLADIHRIPFTYKSNLRDHYPYGLLAVALPEIRRLHASSGTRGKPTIVAYTKNDLEIWAEVCARSLAAAGVEPGDIIHNSYGYGLFTGGLGIHYGAEKLGTTVVPASGGKSQQQVLLLQDLGARVLCSTPSYALNLAYTLEEMGLSCNSIKLEIGVLGAEPWSEALRQQIEQKLNITALDIYGLSEIIGPGISMECKEGKNGLHIWEDHFLAEIVDPVSGEPLPPGNEGELVLTNLSKEALPLLRYRTGDLSMLLPDPCVCGRTMVRMQRVRARLDDMLIVRGVNLYPSEVESLLLEIEELAPHYQLLIDKDKALDKLEVQVEVTDNIVTRWGTFEDGHLELRALTNKITTILKETLGLTAQVTLLPPKSIARSEGKAVRVIDRRYN